MTRALIMILALLLLADIHSKHVKAKVVFAAPPVQHVVQAIRKRP